MAWYLTSSPAASTKSIAVDIPASTQNNLLPLRIEWEIEFEAARFQTDFPVSATPTGPATLIFLRTGSDFELRSPSNANWIVNTGVNLTEFNNFRLRSTFNGTTHTQQLFINGSSTPIATRNPTTAAIGAQAALFALGNSTRAGGIKFYKFTDFVTPANNRFYNASASGGTGTILPETLNGFNGTQSGTWPSDDSEWIFYDDGGATTSTVSYDLGAFGFAVESTVTAPAVTASAAYDLGALGFAVSANVTTPTVAASLDYDLGAFGFAASATSSVPVVQSAIDYSIGDFGFAVTAEATSENNTASISYDLGAFGFAADAASTVPVVSAATAYDLGAFGFSVVADIATAPIASVLYDLGGFGFAASAQVIPPPVEASTVYDLGSFGFSVFATQPTGLRPQAGATLRFTELSRKVAAIELSRSVRYTELSRKVRG